MFDTSNQTPRHPGKHTELAILDLLDQGLSAHQIADRMNLAKPYVVKTIRYFNADDRLRRERAIALGTATLLAAIAAHHPERIPNGHQPC